MIITGGIKISDGMAEFLPEIVKSFGKKIRVGEFYLQVSYYESK